jgi:hypothetical protein
VRFILEFYITQILISTTSRFECISQLIKVTTSFALTITKKETTFPVKSVYIGKTDSESPVLEPENIKLVDVSGSLL